MLLPNTHIILLVNRLLLGYFLEYEFTLLLAHVFLLLAHILNVIFDFKILTELLHLVLIDTDDVVEKFGELVDEFDAEYLQVALAQ